MSELKLYAVDNGWEGAFVTVAESPDEAWDIFMQTKSAQAFNSFHKMRERMTETKIEKGTKLFFCGDNMFGYEDEEE